MKYINAEKLKSLLRERYNTYKIGQHSPFRSGKVETLRETIELIDSLQQEQMEVDLEKELADYCRRYYNYDYPKQAENGTGSSVMPHIIEAAKYFYELGKNSK